MPEQPVKKDITGAYSCCTVEQLGAALKSGEITLRDLRDHYFSIPSDEQMKQMSAFRGRLEKAITEFALLQ